MYIKWLVTIGAYIFWFCHLFTFNVCYFFNTTRMDRFNGKIWIEEYYGDRILRNLVRINPF